MPKRTDLKTICVLGSGPIVIGQAAEFDYSGTQAVKALREQGYKIILINSNPASIMTTSALAHKTYVEPLTFDYVKEILIKEKPCALLPTVGGQTALNLALELHYNGVLKELDVELIGADVEAIEKAENRELFKETMRKVGLPCLESKVCHNEEEALDALEQFGLPIVIRPSFTLGGTGGGSACSKEEFINMVRFGLEQSPNTQVLVEKSVIGHKEFEFEVIRDQADNAVIVCSIENFDPMGVHTGDSITVAPSQTLSDVEYQELRSASLKVLRAIGVKTGGSNVQFSVDPKTGQYHVIEMNPRVSRSSALASKATGYPIAKVAALLAVGFRLDEITNDITKKTTAAFEPSLDYVVTKVPKFSFEKFLGQETTLTTQMRSVGEVMAMGRSFKESLQKAIASLEENSTVLFEPIEGFNLSENLKQPTPKRLWYVAYALKNGWTVDKINDLTGIDKWFLSQLKDIADTENNLAQLNIDKMDKHDFLQLKSDGFLDNRIASLLGVSEEIVLQKRMEHKIKPSFKRVDTCAAEFEAKTPYMYSSYEQPSFRFLNSELVEINSCESMPTGKEKILVLGSGPIRIGQGIEFDCCATECIPALKEMGYETIMINCNPETVSTDFDTADRLYFEPLTFEHVMNVIKLEKPIGVIVQLGGQTPLSLAKKLYDAGVNILGTSPKDIDRAEDRKKSTALFNKLLIKQPESGTASNIEEAKDIAKRIGYPLMVRPSYVLGGRAMFRVYSVQELNAAMKEAFKAAPDKPVLLDKFLDQAVEFDVDALFDGENIYLAGILQHIEEAGIHSGDSSCVLPPYNVASTIIKEIYKTTEALCRELNVRGLLNVQFALKDEDLFIIEANPRASRTVPFISKFTGIPLAQLAAKIMCGNSLPSKLRGKDYSSFLPKDLVAIKTPVMPFLKFPKADPVLGPEMRSTGEAMTTANCFEWALLKGLAASGKAAPTSGGLFVSIADRDKQKMLPAIRLMADAGFAIIATAGTHSFLLSNGIDSVKVNKSIDSRNYVLDLIDNGQIKLMFNTMLGSTSMHGSHLFRKAALLKNIPCFTSISSANALAQTYAKQKSKAIFEVRALQDLYKEQVNEVLNV